MYSNYLYAVGGDTRCKLSHHLARTHDFDSQESPSFHRAGAVVSATSWSRINPTVTVLWILQQCFGQEAELEIFWLLKRQQVFYKYITWSSLLILFTISRNFYLKHFYYLSLLLNSTTTMIVMDRARWRKYSSGDKKENREETFKEWKFTDRDSMTSTVWTPFLILGCYGNLSLMVLIILFKPIGM
jgi:hypothetical protein